MPLTRLEVFFAEMFGVITLRIKRPCHKEIRKSGADGSVDADQLALH